MTVVCGLVDRSGRCWLAGDTQVSAGDERTSGALRKTRRAGGIVLGACGALGPVQAVLSGRWVPRYGPDEEPTGYVEGRLVPALRERLRGHRGDVAVLAGVCGGLWYISRDCCHGYPEGRAAIGTGAPWAKGALDMAEHMRPRPKPRTLLRWAVLVAEGNCSAVSGWGGVVSAG